MLVSQIVPSIRAIVSNFDVYVANVSTWLNDTLENHPDLKNYVIPQVDKASAELEKWLEDTATLIAKSSEILKTVSLSIISFLKATWNFIIGFIISIYVLASKEKFADQSKKNLPLNSTAYSDMECIDEEGNFQPRVEVVTTPKRKSTYALIREKLAEKRATEKKSETKMTEGAATQDEQKADTEESKGNKEEE